MMKKLSGHPRAQAMVHINNDGVIALISYVTTVAVITKDGWLVVYGLYSMTTRKHLAAFAKEYCNLSYQTIKSIYEKQVTMNIHTGEIRSIDCLTI